MDTDKRKILDFLLTNDFDISQGYSYNDLINFLKAYKQFYRECYDFKEEFKRESSKKDKTFHIYDTKIKELEEKLEETKNKNNILTNKISRKLSWKERLIGRFKW